MNLKERRKKIALKPHRTKCCLNCRNTYWEVVGFINCSETRKVIKYDNVCLKHKYERKVEK